jgi:hypothetical protein
MPRLDGVVFFFGTAMFGLLAFLDQAANAKIEL